MILQKIIITLKTQTLFTFPTTQKKDSVFPPSSQGVHSKNNLQQGKSEKILDILSLEIPQTDVNIFALF